MQIYTAIYYITNYFVSNVFLFLAMALFDHVNLVYGTVSEFCTMSGCPDMTGPGQRYGKYL